MYYLHYGGLLYHDDDTSLVTVLVMGVIGANLVVPVPHVQSYSILPVPPKMDLISSDTATKGRQSTDLGPDITSFIRDISLLLHHTILEPDDQRRDQLIGMKLQMPHNCSIDIGCLRCLRVVLIDGLELVDALPAGYGPLHREVPWELVKDRVTPRRRC